MPWRIGRLAEQLAKDGVLSEEDSLALVESATADGVVEDWERVELQQIRVRYADKFEPKAKLPLLEALWGPGFDPHHKPRGRLLSFGVGQGLRHPADDVKALAGALRQRGFEDQRAFLDGDATAAALLGALDEAAATLRQGDTLVVHFSGHGIQVKDADGDEVDGNDEAIVLSDRPVLDDELKACLMKFAAGVNVVLVIDACHSGTIGDLDGAEAPAANVVSLSATTDGRLAADGLFTWSLVRNLTRAGETRPRSYEDLFERVRWDDGYDSDHRSLGSVWWSTSLPLADAPVPTARWSGPDGEVLWNQAPLTLEQD